MRVVTLSALIVSVTATASCARRCGTQCRATTLGKQVFYGGGAFPQPGGGAFPQPGYPYPQPGYPYPQPGYPYPQPGFYPPYPQPGYPQPGYPPNYWYPQPQYPPPAPIYPGFYPPPQQNPQYPYPPYPGVQPGCEGAAGRCSCDASCADFNDCCTDYTYFCGGDEPDRESPFGTKSEGQTCGSTWTGDDLGKCQIGLDCVCVDECADPAIADAPSTCRSGACDRVCAAIYQPLCGTDGYQYANQCLFDIAKCQYSYLAVAYPGECRATSPPTPGPPASSCMTLTDCVSCTSVYQCAWDGRTCFQSFSQLPPPFVSVPAQCPVMPQQCPMYADCVTCATAPGCTWFGAYCQYSQFPVAGYPNDPRQCPVNPMTCTTQTTCGACTSSTSSCYWSSSTNQCVYSQFPLPWPYVSNAIQCPATPAPNTCSSQFTCGSCTSQPSCSWTGSPNNVCIMTNTPITGCASMGCANVPSECGPPVVGG